VKHKVTDCHEAGIRSILDHLPADTSEQMLLARIHDLNNDPAVHGILVQMPLPPHLNPQRVIEAISPLKDVDCFHVSNVGALMTGAPRFMPCTPYGVMKLLEHGGVPLAGANAVVVGRSNIVGKPQAMLLLQSSATVTICHSRTRDLAEHCRRADILVAAVGQAQMITGDMIKPGAVVIDVGMNRVPSGPRAGKLCGDVDFDSAVEVAGAITPVPGGVGPMTRAMLLVNTVEAADRAAGADQNR
jgi:methylenetetrahydrofolate dehydrogenase (NADP+)/methenyltetrahydrofolate cyclohydrolase